MKGQTQIKRTDSYIVQSKEQKLAGSSSLTNLFLGAAGIYGAYITLAIFSEKLYSHQYESDVQFGENGIPLKHQFKFPSLLVWFSGLLCAIFGRALSAIRKQKQNPISLRQQGTLGLLFTLNMMTTNFALLFLSYPTQVIGRNSRYLFVVLVGAFFSRVPHKADIKLPKHKLYVAIFITLGVLLFNFMKDAGGDAADHHDPSQAWKGYTLLIVSIISDALFSDSQAYSKVTFKPTANHLFTSANFFTFIFCFAFSVFDGSLFPSINFIFQHSQCLKDLFLVGILQVAGQLSIYYVVANFKQHIFPLISATRKIFTILFSILIYHHTLSNYQWLAVLIVFAGMIVQVYEQISQKRQKDNSQNSGSKSVQGQKQRAKRQ